MGSDIDNREGITLPIISIHAPVWGATNATVYHISGKHNFNPRSRVGSDAIIFSGGCNMTISIHAPVWGATCRGYLRCGRRPISIHAPVWGATYMHFCSRLLKKISIHAPVWGATAAQGNHQQRHKHFNPRSRVGSDTTGTVRQTTSSRFQSTLPCGERPPDGKIPDGCVDFNPRSRVGSDGYS